jgi:hypothetical protein
VRSKETIDRVEMILEDFSKEAESTASLIVSGAIDRHNFGGIAGGDKFIRNV